MACIVELTPEQLRELMGAVLTDAEAQALAGAFAAQQSAMAAFNFAELKGLEPPLRSTPGPKLQP
jgi:hypothetical protein